MNRFHPMCDGARDLPSRFSYLHGRDSGALSAFEITENALLSLELPRLLGASQVHIDIFSEDLRYIKSVIAKWIRPCKNYDEYTAKLDIKSLGVGLYFLRPRVKVYDKELYGHRAGEILYFDERGALDNLIQLSVCNFKYNAPNDIYGGIIYHIFVDRFNRGGNVTVPSTARVINGEWTQIPEYPAYNGAHLKNNTFYGGTLWGIVDKLDYIASLGVSALYLSPIFKATSNHKYDTGDYMQVDEIFGGDEALTTLCREAEKRDIKVILDGVFNHTGDDSKYFNRYGNYDSLGAYQSKSSPYYSWYSFQNHPREYTSWWGIEILPRINTENSNCAEYFVGEGGVIDKYSNMGVYGFRLDVADELPDGFIEKIKARLAERGDSIVYGEVWEDASNKIAYDKRKRYYLGTELDGVMNYPVRAGIIDYLTKREVGALKYALTEVTNNAPKRIRDAQMNLLGTHDTERILTVLGGESAAGKSNSYLVSKRMNNHERAYARKKLILAYTILATIPGIPTIFYGDEAGLEGYHDPFNRMPYPWGREDKEILSYYRKIGNIRRNNDLYRDGEFELLMLTPDILLFKRYKGKEAMITAINNSDASILLTFSGSASATLSSKEANCHKLSANSAEIFKVAKDTAIFLEK